MAASTALGSQCSMLKEDRLLDAVTAATKDNSEVEVMGVNDSKENASEADNSQVEGTAEMEGVTIGVSHEILTAGLTNLKRKM